MSVLDDIKYQFKARNVLMQIIIVNVGLFVLLNLIGFIFYIAGKESNILWYHAITNLAMPYSPHELVYKPWTLITHFIFHAEFGHLFWNMLTLYFFGRIFSEYAGNSRLLAMYVYGALAGAALSFLCYLLIPRLQEIEPAAYMLGASGGIMAIVVGAATLVPNLQVNLLFIGNVPFKYIAIFYVVLDLVSLQAYTNSGGHIAHLGGAALGYLSMTSFKKGKDWTRPFNDFFEWIRALFSGKKRMKVVHNNRMRKTDEQFNLEKNKLQQQMDAILDKISRSGYESLNKEEKEILFKSSKKL